MPRAVHLRTWHYAQAVENCARQPTHVMVIFAPRSSIGKSRILFKAATAQTVSDKLFNVEDLLVTVHRTRKATAEVTASSQVCASVDIRCKFIEALCTRVGMNPRCEQRMVIPHPNRLQGSILLHGGSPRQLWTLGYELNKNEHVGLRAVA